MGGVEVVVKPGKGFVVVLCDGYVIDLLGGGDEG